MSSFPLGRWGGRGTINGHSIEAVCARESDNTANDNYRYRPCYLSPLLPSVLAATYYVYASYHSYYSRCNESIRGIGFAVPACVAPASRFYREF